MPSALKTAALTDLARRSGSGSSSVSGVMASCTVRGRFAGVRSPVGEKTACPHIAVPWKEKPACRMTSLNVQTCFQPVPSLQSGWTTIATRSLAFGGSDALSSVQGMRPSST